MRTTTSVFIPNMTGKLFPPSKVELVTKSNVGNRKDKWVLSIPKLHFFSKILLRDCNPILGDFAANHAKERVKRRKSLTKLSINELGVDDTHPWLPRSPNPLTPPTEYHDKSPGGRSPRSPSGQSPKSGGSGSAKVLGSKEDPNRNLFFENVKPAESTNEKLECMDRTSFRRLMDDLDNITIQESIYIFLDFGFIN